MWDVCGVKTAILEAAQVLPGTVDFIGCHPMAGTEFSGVEHAFAEMFRDSHFLLVPRDDSRPEHIALLERLAAYIGRVAGGLWGALRGDLPAHPSD